MTALKLRTKAIAPIVSTLILMAILLFSLSIALTFVQRNLTRRAAENDFNSAKIFMKTVGLQIDNVAWITGRTETVQYTANNGEVSLKNQLLNYTIQVKYVGSALYEVLASYEVGVLFFNVPLSKYYLNNQYYEEILPTKTETLIFNGTSATVARVFAIQKNPILGEAEYIRVVAAPNIRYLPSSISMMDQSTFYVKLYLPNLVLRTEPKVSRSLTFSGKYVNIITETNIESIMVTLSFPQSDLGFDNVFFHFPELTQIISIPEDYDQTVVELYTSEVQVDIGI